MGLNELLEAAAEKMAGDLRQRLISHPGELGTAREEIVRDFLRSHLPSRFDVSTGFAFDSSGKISRQLDVVIFDVSVCPRFEIPGGKFLFPCEAVAAVGQVKSSLTGRQQLRDAIENLASVKSLDRSANGTAYDLRFNERLAPDENHLHQIFTFIFVTGRSTVTGRRWSFIRVWKHRRHTWADGRKVQNHRMHRSRDPVFEMVGVIGAAR